MPFHQRLVECAEPASPEDFGIHWPLTLYALNFTAFMTLMSCSDMPFKWFGLPYSFYPRLVEFAEPASLDNFGLQGCLTLYALHFSFRRLHCLDAHCLLKLHPFGVLPVTERVQDVPHSFVQAIVVWSLGQKQGRS